MGVDDIPIGSVDFDFIKSAITPELTVEFGYTCDAGYTGNVVSFPGSSTKR